MTGIFITFEGPEGAGKSTQIQLLARFLEQNSFPVLMLREPGGTVLGEKIRQLLLDPAGQVSAAAEVLLYAAARAQLVSEMIKPAINQGKVVLCDRYVDASIAYQGWGRNLGPALVRSINFAAVAGVMPDLTVLLDLSPEQGLTRARGRGAGTDRIESEKLGFHETVRQGYLALAAEEPERFLVIDATLSLDDIAAQVFHRVSLLLANKGMR